MKPSVIVYDHNLGKVAYLENAFAIGYELPLNNLWRASFSLPADDDKNAECQPLRFVEIYDNGVRIDLFRITPTSARRSRDGQTIQYSCEHVLGTLMDDVMFQYHTVGNLGVYTADVIDYVLARQTVERWQIGTVDFDRQFEYNWENENLLGAMYSIPKPFVNEYQWTWDTSSYPWTLNLVEPIVGAQAYIRYGYNMQGITKTTDPLDLCTRLFCLGYGEGVNQLTIADVNDGLPYLDADTQATYGVISRIFIDRRFDNAESLKARGQAILEELKTPRISYQVDAADISSITADPVDRFTTGTQVRVIDEEFGVDIIGRVVNVRKSNVTGAPGDVQLEIANKTADITGSITELAERQRIEAAYAQGATNFDTHVFVDNCDPTHPAIMRFWVPEETVRINRVLLSFESESFRAYSRAIEAAPATSSGPSSINTTQGGGQQINTQTGENIWRLSEPYSIPEVTEFVDDHAHGIVPHYHVFDIPPHVHEMPHTHTIPAHTHGIEYGIYEGPTPTAIGVLVDGNLVPGSDTASEELDLLPYLAKDSEGKIRRGQWHTIEIVPNSLGRINASLLTQIFVQSRGGGNY